MYKKNKNASPLHKLVKFCISIYMYINYANILIKHLFFKNRYKQQSMFLQNSSFQKEKKDSSATNNNKRKSEMSHRAT